MEAPPLNFLLSPHLETRMDQALATRVAGEVAPGQASSLLLGHHTPRLTRWAPGAPRVTVPRWYMRLVAGLQLQEAALTCGLGLTTREVTFVPESGFSPGGSGSGCGH